MFDMNNMNSVAIWSLTAVNDGYTRSICALVVTLHSLLHMCWWWKRLFFET